MAAHDETSGEMLSAPAVTVVIATYNRSNVLRYALESLLWQTFDDWEAWIIGDACTDDTADVVASFCDRRLNFHNLGTNVGEQSGPTNEGTRRARGRYIAYLNHDDLWLPCHLQTLVETIERESADIAFSVLNQVRHGDQARAPGRIGALRPDGRYDPRIGVPASCRLVRREFAERIGPWRNFREISLAPTQEWMFRAWKAGARIVQAPRMTVLAFASGKRPDSYVRGDASEQKAYVKKIRGGPEWIEAELTDIALGLRAHALDLQSPDVLLRGALRNLWEKILLRIGIHPRSVSYFLRFGGRGGFIRHLRRVRGLNAAP